MPCLPKPALGPAGRMGIRVARTAAAATWRLARWTKPAPHLRCCPTLRPAVTVLPYGLRSVLPVLRHGSHARRGFGLTRSIWLASPYAPKRAVLHACWSPPAWSFALRALLSPSPARGSTRERAWKLIFLLPRLLFTRGVAAIGGVGKAALLQRLEDFHAGRWSALYDAAVASRPGPPTTLALTDEARRERACAQVKRGDLSQARQTLTAAALAPGNEATLAALQDPARRPPEPLRPLPAALASVPRVHLSAAAVADSLRTAKKGAAAGLSGATAERYKLLLADEEALAQFAEVATLLANGDVPEEALSALALARLTALQKPGGGTRGIATGDAFRRLVARSWPEGMRPASMRLRAPCVAGARWH